MCANEIEAKPFGKQGRGGCTERPGSRSHSVSWMRFLAVVIGTLVYLGIGAVHVPGQSRNLPPLGEGERIDEYLQGVLTDAENAERDADEARLARPLWGSTQAYIVRAQERRQQVVTSINRAIRYSGMKPAEVASLLRKRAQMLKDRAQHERNYAKKFPASAAFYDKLADADESNARQYEKQAAQVEIKGRL
jgi:hypothetical protein